VIVEREVCAPLGTRQDLTIAIQRVAMTLKVPVDQAIGALAELLPTDRAAA
jgi:hypothetical protein